MSWKGGIASFCAAFAVIAAPASAPAAEPTRAESLFREARAQMAKGDYAAACAMLEESQRLDPGAGTEFNLARCYELAGRFVEAWGAYVDVAGAMHAAGDVEREAVARERIAAIEPRVGAVVADDAIQWSREASAAPVRAPAAALAPVPDARPEARASSRRETIALALGAGALAAATLGVYEGLSAFGRASDAHAHCDATGCDPVGVDASRDAHRAATIATVAFVSSAALAAGGVTVWLTGSGAVVRGEF